MFSLFATDSVQRKGKDDLCAAFVLEFTLDDNVELYLPQYTLQVGPQLAIAAAIEPLTAAAGLSAEDVLRRLDRVKPLSYVAEVRILSAVLDAEGWLAAGMGLFWRLCAP